MEDILKAEIPINEKNFWYGAGAKIQKRVKGIVQVFYNKNDNLIVIKIFFEKFNYSINSVFPRWQLIDETNVINKVLNAVRFNIYEEIFE